LHSALFHAGNSETSVSTRKSIREISQAEAWAEDVEKQLSEITHASCSDNKDLRTCWNRDRKQVAERENVIHRHTREQSPRTGSSASFYPLHLHFR